MDKADEWRVRVEGHPFDLEDAAARFKSPSLVVKKDEADGFYYLTSARFADRSEAEDVRKEADRLLRILNGLGRLGGQQQLTASHVFRSYADGRKDAFVFVGGAIDVRGHVNPVTVLADGKPVARREPRESAWVTAALADPVVEKVVALYRLEHNWANLSKVLEAIEEDVGPAHRQGWVSRSARGRFRHTANSYRATGEGARHALERHAPPENPMPLSEGEELVAHVLQRWLESRAR